MAIDAAVLPAIKVDYEEGDLTVDGLGKKYGCSGGYISALARKHHWKPRAARTGRRRSRPRPRQESPAGVARRLYRVINLNLEMMEKHMESGKLGTEELERASKTLGPLVQGVQKVAAAASEEDGSKSNADGTAAINEIERLQREIVERLERIQRRREAERGSR